MDDRQYPPRDSYIQTLQNYRALQSSAAHPRLHSTEPLPRGLDGVTPHCESKPWPGIGSTAYEVAVPATQGEARTGAPMERGGRGHEFEANPATVALTVPDTQNQPRMVTSAALDISMDVAQQCPEPADQRNLDTESLDNWLDEILGARCPEEEWNETQQDAVLESQLPAIELRSYSESLDG
ncbi:hypothetical protein BDV95DRAFT_143060 [Massariosphaeria phaeospora]|uniref:Uncharacterized protein n=1 Tax=Massariosphaeria phaeospora TaxID=100035 RepID=A0A7C8MUJ0_9PLEO|nr:hypothetical protein BDV95DRAFT_143060 [Massariosphaeria phaeospora]